MKKDKNFYNRESVKYSAKRYPEVATNYIQFFFKKRLNLVLSLLKNSFNNKKDLNLLEIGCADGVVLREIRKKNSNIFLKIIGIDNSPGMINEARNKGGDKISYFLRGEEPIEDKYDVIIEVGVANYADIKEELLYTKKYLKDNGLYILSLAGKGSINSFFNKDDGYNNFLSYKEYEGNIKEFFEIKKIIPVGIFAPLIWKIPAFASIVQPIIEYFFCLFSKNLFHEKVYLLKHK